MKNEEKKIELTTNEQGVSILQAALNARLSRLFEIKKEMELDMLFDTKQISDKIDQTLELYRQVCKEWDKNWPEYDYALDR